MKPYILITTQGNAVSRRASKHRGSYSSLICNRQKLGKNPLCSHGSLYMVEQCEAFHREELNVQTKEHQVKGRHCVWYAILRGFKKSTATCACDLQSSTCRDRLCQEVVIVMPLKKGLGSWGQDERLFFHYVPHFLPFKFCTMYIFTYFIFLRLTN